MSAPLSRQYAQVDAVKLVYDLKTSMLYYINNRKSSFHYDFCTKYLAYEGDLSEFNSVEYGHKGSRRFLLANLNYYHASDVYSLVAHPQNLKSVRIKPALSRSVLLGIK